MTIFFIVTVSIIIILLVLVNFSTVKINVKELEIKGTKVVKFNLKLTLNLFNKIPFFKLTLDKERLSRVKQKEIEVLNKILKSKILNNYGNVEPFIIKNWKKILKELGKIKIEKINLDATIGTKSADTTALATTAVSIAVPIAFARRVDKIHYNVQPIYINKNYFFLSINCIIAIKLVHIIGVRKILT